MSNHDEELDVLFWYSGCYLVDPLPVDEPDLAIKTVGGAKVLTIGDVGFLDDRTLKDIMDPWFAERLAMDRWSWTFSDWWSDMNKCVITPFRTKVNNQLIVKQWKYGGEMYHYSEVNYIGLGFGAAHFKSIYNLNILNKRMPYVWNILKYWHLPGADQYWFSKGFDLYPR